MTFHRTPVFVYGTLRAGEALSHLIPADADRYTAATKGTLHYHPETMGYPVFRADGPYESEVVGDLVFLDLDDRQVSYMVCMELQAGYEARWVAVFYDGEYALDALAFVWPDAPGALIEGGDWTRRNERFDCAECGESYLTTEHATACFQQHINDDYEHALGKENA